MAMFKDYLSMKKIRMIACIRNLAACLLISLLSFSSRADKGAPEALKIYDLKCQDMSDPVGTNTLHPVFSWKLSSVQKDVRQRFYRIRVATSLQALAGSSADLWDSGKIPSDRQAFIRYEGKALAPAKKYYWQVQVWDNKGNEGRSGETADFITGLTTEDAWKDARWIAFEKLPDSLKVFPGVHGSGDNLGEKALKRAVIPYFRRELHIRKKIAAAYLCASGLGQYAFYINGQRIDSAFLQPAWSDYRKRCYYNMFDVTSFLQQGNNALGAIVGTGFLYISRERYRKLVIAQDYPMLRAKLIIRYADGTEESVVSDEHWQTAPSPIAFSSIYGGEDFDGTKIREGWSSAGFAAKDWKAAQVVPGPGGIMQAQEDYPLSINEIFHPVKIDSADPYKYIYDFGQNTSGIIHLEAKAPKGYRIRITPAELLDKNGNPDQSASGSPYYYSYIFAGKGRESWQPLFSYYGFRYAAAEIYDPEGKKVPLSTLEKLQLVSLHTQNAAPQAGSFACSSELFNKIFQLIRWGIRNNMASVATDCPHREKLGWLEETHLIGASIQYNYDILGFYKKIIRDMMDAQQPSGLVPDIAPEYVVFVDGFRDSPEWGSACVLLPWYVYQWYGDKTILAESYDMMKKYVAYLGSQAKDHLLAYGLGDWFDLGPKQPGVSQLTPLGLTATAFYYYDAAILSKTAALLNDPAGAALYAKQAETIRQAFNKKYFNAATKVYATGSQTSYAIPLYFHIVDPSERDDVFRHLVQSVTTNNNALTAGDIGFRYVVQALEDGGEDQLIYAMNNRDDVPGYGYQIRKGATALTESWQALTNVSNDHMMLGHLMEWLYSGLAGIRQQNDGSGYRHIIIAPQYVKGIDSVNASFNSIHGKVAVRWLRNEDGRISLHVEIPANTDAQVIFPVSKGARITEEGQPLRAGKNGIHQVKQAAERTIVSTGSGTYDFSCSGISNQ